MHTPLIKICGITNVEDAQAAVEAGADFLGFIFYPPSPRYVDPEKIRKITSLFKGKIRSVGVFVDESSSRISALMDFCGLDIAQLHGAEDAEQARTIGENRVWKAFWFRNPNEESQALTFPCQAVLVDAETANATGGTGTCCDWDKAAKLATKRQLVLAGGLNPENIVDAIRIVNPYAVDVSSGIEQTRGIKDHDKLRLFINNIHEAAKLNKS